VKPLLSSLIKSPHAFLTRDGGVSRGPFASLNTSLTVGDDPLDVAENLERLSSAFGVRPQQLVTVNQVHGTQVLEATSGTGGLGDADGVFTRSPGLLLGVRTADCLPILIEDVESGQVAAVHAGWRGVLGEIVLRAIERMGVSPSRIAVALGPAIQACCFEVNGDLPSRFSAAFGAEVIRPQSGKSRVHLDLAWAVGRSLSRAGVPDSQVDVLPHCTRCDSRFFSYRREEGRTGRQLALIQCARATSV
jgi:polyphenol oxidase